MILMIYTNDSNIFILIYPCYISILLYRLYSTILCIQLSCCFIYAWYLYTCLYTLKYLYDDTQARTYILYTFAYLIYAFIWHLLSALHTFYSLYAALLLYDTHIFAASRAGSGAFQYMRSIYLLLSGSLQHWRSMHMRYTRYILFIYFFSIIYDLLYKLYPSFYIKSGYFLSLFYLYGKNH